MYCLTYYGLSYNPFDKHMVSEKDRFPSRDITEMIQRLEYLKTVCGVGVFTARPGLGKTFGLRCFASGLNQSLYHMEYICLSTVSVFEFYRQFCSVLGVSTKGGKPGMFKAIQDEIWSLYKEKHQPLLLAVDEAQYLSTAVLNDLKMLMNFGYDSVNCFTLILCGESHLNRILSKPVHESLRQRIKVHYNFEGLDDEEAPKYVLHKLKCAGAAESLMAQSGLAAINNYSQGNPRVIDNLMSDALALGAQMEKESIDSEVILAAVNNQAL